MPTDEVTREDHAALRLYMVERARLAFDGKTAPHADLLLTILAAHRTASEQRGYDRAIAEVVAWLREHHDGRLVSRIYLASAIEAGEHKP